MCLWWRKLCEDGDGRFSWRGYVVREMNDFEDRRRTWVLFYGGKESSAVECGLVEPFFSNQ